jgi:biotin transport system substrate-specific component
MNLSYAKTDTLPGAMLASMDIPRSIGLVIGFSLLTALSAQFVIPLPFTPIPVTGQTFAVLLTGALLGSRLGALAMIAYLVEGASGLPFFRSGNGGAHYLFLAPSAGYLLSYPFAAFVTGWLAERGWDRRFLTSAAAMLAGAVVILTSGWAWQAAVSGSASYAFAAGVAPFVPVEILKIAAAAMTMPMAWSLLKLKGSGR